MQNFDYTQYLESLTIQEKKNAPRELFLRGDSSLLTKNLRVAVVGSRNPSDEGIRRCVILVKNLVESKITVVSGLADGIDTIAHETAIKEKGKTIAVLGTPLDKVYPIKNTELFNRIVKEGHLAISQFPKGYPSQKTNFPMRNRTMALISDATIIVEASENSGTRHQGWEALRLGRMVFIMANVAENPSISWPKEMIKYGAQVLTRDDLPFLLDIIPCFTSSICFDY